MKPGLFYRHENFMDVMVKVKKVYDIHRDYIKIKVDWWSKTYKMPLKVTQTLKINKSDLDKWEVVNEKK